MEDIVFALEGAVVAIIIATCCYLPLADWGLENPTSFGLVFMVLCGFFGFIYLVLRGSLNES